MAFDLNGFNQVSSGKNTESFTVYSYLTTDTFVQVSAPTYFVPHHLALKPNDMIEVSTSVTDTVNTYQFLRVVSSNSFNVIVIEQMKDDEGFITQQQFVGPEFFVGVPNVQADTMLINQLPQKNTFESLFFQVSFIGTIAGTMNLEVGVESIAFHNFDISGPENVKFVFPILIPPLTLLPDKKLFIRRTTAAQVGVTGLYATWIWQTN